MCKFFVDCSPHTWTRTNPAAALRETLNIDRFVRLTFDARHEARDSYAPRRVCLAARRARAVPSSFLLVRNPAQSVSTRLSRQIRADEPSSSTADLRRGEWCHALRRGALHGRCRHGTSSKQMC